MMAMFYWMDSVALKTGELSSLYSSLFLSITRTPFIQSGEACASACFNDYHLAPSQSITFSSLFTWLHSHGSCYGDDVMASRPSLSTLPFSVIAPLWFLALRKDTNPSTQVMSIMIIHSKVLEELATIHDPLSFNDIELFLMGFLRPTVGSSDFALFKRFIRLLRFHLGETPSVQDLRFLLAVFDIFVESSAGMESTVHALAGKGMLEMSQIGAFLDIASRCCVSVEGVLSDGGNSNEKGNDKNSPDNKDATISPENDPAKNGNDGNTAHSPIDTLMNSLSPPTSQMAGNTTTLLFIANIVQKCGNCTNPAQFCQQFLSFIHQQNSPLFSSQINSVNNWSNLIPHDETPIFHLVSTGRNSPDF